jgi:hypothetical protein
MGTGLPDPPAREPSRESEDDLRDQLSSVQGVMPLARLMTESADRDRILEMVAKTLASLGRCHLDGVWLFDAGWRATAGACAHPAVRADVEREVRGLAVGGAIHIPGAEWSWAEPPRSPTGPLGYVVVTAGQEPSGPERFLLRSLSQQLGMALTNAALLARERTQSENLRTANRALGESVAAVERSTGIHERLTQVAASGLGEAGRELLPSGEATGWSIFVSIPAIITVLHTKKLDSRSMGHDQVAASALRQLRATGIPGSIAGRRGGGRGRACRRRGGRHRSAR